MGRGHRETTLTAHHDCEFREMLNRVGDKWSLLVIVMLEQRPTQRARFSELKRSIPGISQRMLTATLRSLERDGLRATCIPRRRLGSSTSSRRLASGSCSRCARLWNGFKRTGRRSERRATSSIDGRAVAMRSILRS